LLSQLDFRRRYAGVAGVGFFCFVLAFFFLFFQFSVFPFFFYFFSSPSFITFHFMFFESCNQK